MSAWRKTERMDGDRQGEGGGGWDRWINCRGGESGGVTVTLFLLYSLLLRKVRDRQK